MDRGSLIMDRVFWIGFPSIMDRESIIMDSRSIVYFGSAMVMAQWALKAGRVLVLRLA